MTRRSLFSCFSLIWILFGSLANGQLTSDDRDRILREIDVATGQLDPGRLPNLDTTTAELLQRVAAVKAYFDEATDADNRDAWLRYLDLDPLTTAIAEQASAADLAKEALEVHDRLIGTTPGLELTAVRQLRASLTSFVDALRFRNAEQSIELLEGQLQALAALIEQVDASPTPDDFSAISARVALLKSSGQADGLIQEIRSTFGRPNASIRIGSSLVEQAISRRVSRNQPVSDCILGTRLIGRAEMEGTVSANLLPSQGTATIELSFHGNVSTANDGFNGPIRLKSVGNGDVSAFRTMTVDAAGIAFGETTSEASLSTRITCIQHQLALVRAIARKQAAKQKPAADRIALKKLRSQVADQFASETQAVNPVTPSQLLERSQPMLQRLSLTKPTQLWSSTEDEISIETVFRGDDQLSTVVSRPNVVSPFAFAIQVHESIVENAFSVILAGRTLNERRLNDLLERVTRNQPATEESSEEPPFEISFSRSRPVIFEAREGMLRIGLRGTRFSQGDRAPLVKAMEITAIYQAVTGEDGKVVLQRSGDVEVDFPRERLTLREVGLKPIIQKEFSEIFPEQILDQGIRVADDAKVQSLRGRQFLVSSSEANDGWLTLVFQ